MIGVRLARGVTGRDRIVKFAGCYHGHSDALLAAGGSGVATLGLPGSAGVPDGGGGRHGRRPLQRGARARRRRGRVSSSSRWPPTWASSRRRRASSRACGRRATAAGALLIFDEVITGFRLGPAAAPRAASASRPTCGSSARSSAAACRSARSAAGRDVMAVLAPVGPVYQAGTLSGNPLATAAGLAVLDLLDDDAYVAARGDGRPSWPPGCADVIAEAGLAVSGARGRARWSACSSPTAPPCATTTRPRRPPTAAATPGFFHGLLDRGVALAPGPYEVLFPSLAHTDDDIDRTVDRRRRVAAPAEPPHDPFDVRLPRARAQAPERG